MNMQWKTCWRICVSPCSTTPLTAPTPRSWRLLRLSVLPLDHCPFACEMWCPKLLELSLEVSGLENGEDSQDLFSFSKESSWNANFCFSAWEIKDTGSHCELCLFLLRMGLPPGDRSIARSLTLFKSFRTSNMFGTSSFFWFFEWRL